jgi:cytochrome c-type biogenesis protein CcmE
MRKTHIVIIVIIALGIAAIMSTFTDASTYVSFPLAEKNEGKQFTVIGYLNKDADMDYSPERNQFSFTAIDKEGNERRVVYFQPKPQDFERSEEITMKGFATDTAFVAEQILMKCPSKYNETNDVENTYE